MLLRTWPDVHRATGARLRLIGADPLAVSLLQRRLGVSSEGIDVLGFLNQDELTRELLAAKALAAPSLGGESFGMVLTRAFACALPVVASDIPGYRDVTTPETSVDPAGRSGGARAGADRPAGGRASAALAGSGGARAREREYAWDSIAERLRGIYELVAGEARVGAPA